MSDAYPADWKVTGEERPKRAGDPCCGTGKRAKGLAVQGGVSIHALRAKDAYQSPPKGPAEAAQGKLRAKSLLCPQELAWRVLPKKIYDQVAKFAREGCPADCGERWPRRVQAQALRAGPHNSALTPKGVELLWEDIQYQVDAGFVRIKSEEELFRNGFPPELKISRVAVVPQTNRRDRIILNLSAEVMFPATRCRTEE